MEAILFAGMGGHALVAQVILLREILVVLSGHEIALGVILASWLAGVLGGARWGGRVGPVCRDPQALFLGLLVASTVAAVALVLAIRHLPLFFPTSPGVPLPLFPSLLVSFLLVAPEGVLTGALFPVAATVSSRGSSGARDHIGRVYVWEAVGSLLAGVLLTYVLLPRWDSLTVLVLAGVGVLFSAAICPAGARRRWAVLPAAACGVGILGLVTGAVHSLHLHTVQARWEARHPGMGRVATADSLYQNVEVGRLGDQYSVFGNGHLLATFPDPWEAGPMVHLTMNQTPRPQSVLLLGGGPGSFLPLLLGYPLKELRVVELDPLVFHLAKEHLPRNERQALGDPRVSLFFTDARYFVKHLPPASLDAVILRMPDPSTALLNRYHTVEFFQDLRRALRPHGILTHAVKGAVNYAGADLKDYVGLVYRSLRRVFPEVLAVPGERMIFLASPASGGLSLDPGILASRLGDLPQFSSSVPREMFSVWIDPQQRGVWEKALLDDEGLVNEDARPISYLRFLALWDLVSSRRFGESPLRHLQSLPYAAALSGSVLLVFLLLLGPTGAVWERAPLVVMGISGFTAMAQEILCLYMYQALRGYLYSRLGLLVALFMAGLALGTRVASRQRPAGAHRLLRALILVQGFAILVCASVVLGCAPHLFGADSARFPDGALELLFGLWMILAGAATGATFSLACGLQILRGGSMGAVAGRVYGWDHLGAALGALVPGVVLVPLFGVAQTGFLLVVLLGAGACILFLNLLAFSKSAGIGCLGPSR